MDTYPPTKGELRDYLKAHGLDSRKVGVMLEVSSSIVRKWMNDRYPQTISYSCWYTLKTLVERTPPD